MHVFGFKLQKFSREKNENCIKKRGEKALKCIFLGYKLKNFAGVGFRLPPCRFAPPAAKFVGGKNESQKRGGMIVGYLIGIYLQIPDQRDAVWRREEQEGRQASAGIRSNLSGQYKVSLNLSLWILIQGYKIKGKSECSQKKIFFFRRKIYLSELFFLMRANNQSGSTTLSRYAKEVLVPFWIINCKNQ